jgi:hypothetical protein
MSDHRDYSDAFYIGPEEENKILNDEYDTRDLVRALKRYMSAVKSLGERVPGKSYLYFEANLREDDGALGLWRELNDAGVEARNALKDGE